MNMNFQSSHQSSEASRDIGRTLEQHRRSHTLILTDRQKLQISGVSDVVRFDELSAEMQTSFGDLLIEGDGLRIEVFDTERGEVTLSGNIRTLDYYEAHSDKSEKKRSFFGKR